MAATDPKSAVNAANDAAAQAAKKAEEARKAAEEAAKQAGAAEQARKQVQAAQAAKAASAKTPPGGAISKAPTAKARAAELKAEDHAKRADAAADRAEQQAKIAQAEAQQAQRAQALLDSGKAKPGSVDPAADARQAQAAAAKADANADVAQREAGAAAQDARRGAQVLAQVKGSKPTGASQGTSLQAPASGKAAAVESDPSVKSTNDAVTRADANARDARTASNQATAHAQDVRDQRVALEWQASGIGAKADNRATSPEQRKAVVQELAQIRRDEQAATSRAVRADAAADQAEAKAAQTRNFDAQTRAAVEARRSGAASLQNAKDPSAVAGNDPKVLAAAANVAADESGAWADQARASARGDDAAAYGPTMSNEQVAPSLDDARRSAEQAAERASDARAASNAAQRDLQQANRDLREQQQNTARLTVRATPTDASDGGAASSAVQALLRVPSARATAAQRNAQQRAVQADRAADLAEQQAQFAQGYAHQARANAAAGNDPRVASAAAAAANDEAGLRAQQARVAAGLERGTMPDLPAPAAKTAASMPGASSAQTTATQSTQTPQATQTTSTQTTRPTQTKPSTRTTTSTPSKPSTPTTTPAASTAKNAPNARTTASSTREKPATSTTPAKPAATKTTDAKAAKQAQLLQQQKQKEAALLQALQGDPTVQSAQRSSAQASAFAKDARTQADTSAKQALASQRTLAQLQTQVTAKGKAAPAATREALARAKVNEQGTRQRAVLTDRAADLAEQQAQLSQALAEKTVSLRAAELLGAGGADTTRDPNAAVASDSRVTATASQVAAEQAGQRADEARAASLGLDPAAVRPKVSPQETQGAVDLAKDASAAAQTNAEQARALADTAQAQSRQATQARVQAQTRMTAASKQGKSDVLAKQQYMKAVAAEKQAQLRAKVADQGADRAEQQARVSQALAQQAVRGQAALASGAASTESAADWRAPVRNDPRVAAMGAVAAAEASGMGTMQAQAASTLPFATLAKWQQQQPKTSAAGVAAVPVTRAANGATTLQPSGAAAIDAMTVGAVRDSSAVAQASTPPALRDPATVKKLEAALAKGQSPSTVVAGAKIDMKEVKVNGKAAYQPVLLVPNAQPKASATTSLSTPAGALTVPGEKPQRYTSIDLGKPMLAATLQRRQAAQRRPRGNALQRQVVRTRAMTPSQIQGELNRLQEQRRELYRTIRDTDPAINATARATMKTADAQDAETLRETRRAYTGAAVSAKTRQALDQSAIRADQARKNRSAKVDRARSDLARVDARIAELRELQSSGGYVTRASTAASIESRKAEANFNELNNRVMTLDAQLEAGQALNLKQAFEDAAKQGPSIKINIGTVDGVDYGTRPVTPKMVIDQNSVWVGANTRANEIQRSKLALDKSRPLALRTGIATDRVIMLREDIVRAGNRGDVAAVKALQRDLETQVTDLGNASKGYFETRKAAGGISDRYLAGDEVRVFDDLRRVDVNELAWLTAPGASRDAETAARIDVVRSRIAAFDGEIGVAVTRQTKAETYMRNWQAALDARASSVIPLPVVSIAYQSVVPVSTAYQPVSVVMPASGSSAYEVPTNPIAGQSPESFPGLPSRFQPQPAIDPETGKTIPNTFTFTIGKDQVTRARDAGEYRVTRQADGRWTVTHLYALRPDTNFVMSERDSALWQKAADRTQLTRDLDAKAVRYATTATALQAAYGLEAPPLPKGKAASSAVTLAQQREWQAAQDLERAQDRLIDDPNDAKARAKVDELAKQFGLAGVDAAAARSEIEYSAVLAQAKRAYNPLVSSSPKDVERNNVLNLLEYEQARTNLKAAYGEITPDEAAKLTAGTQAKVTDLTWRVDHPNYRTRATGDDLATWVGQTLSEKGTSASREEIDAVVRGITEDRNGNLAPVGAQTVTASRITVMTPDGKGTVDKTVFSVEQTDDPTNIPIDEAGAAGAVAAASARPGDVSTFVVGDGGKTFDSTTDYIKWYGTPNVSKWDAGLDLAVGLGEMATGAALGWFGAPIIVDGGARAIHGIEQLVTGKQSDPYLARGLQEAGVKREVALRADTGVGLVLGVAGGGAFVFKQGAQGIKGLVAADGAAGMAQTASAPSRLVSAGRVAAAGGNTYLLGEQAYTQGNYVVTGEQKTPWSSQALMATGLSETQANYVQLFGGLAVGLGAKHGGDFVEGRRASRLLQTVPGAPREVFDVTSYFDGSARMTYVDARGRRRDVSPTDLASLVGRDAVARDTTGVTYALGNGQTLKVHFSVLDDAATALGRRDALGRDLRGADAFKAPTLEEAMAAQLRAGAPETSSLAAWADSTAPGSRYLKVGGRVVEVRPALADKRFEAQGRRTTEDVSTAVASVPATQPRREAAITVTDLPTWRGGRDGGQAALPVGSPPVGTRLDLREQGWIPPRDAQGTPLAGDALTDWADTHGATVRPDGRIVRPAITARPRRELRGAPEAQTSVHGWFDSGAVPRTGLDDDFDASMARSPTYVEQLTQLQERGWAIQIGHPEKAGSFADIESKTIVIDERVTDPGAFAGTLAHEMGHALYPRDTASRDTALFKLIDEIDASFNVLRIRDELSAAGGPRIVVPGSADFVAAIEGAYERMSKTAKGSDPWRREMADLVLRLGAFEKTSTTGQTYGDYYLGIGHPPAEQRPSAPDGEGGQGGRYEQPSAPLRAELEQWRRDRVAEAERDLAQARSLPAKGPQTAALVADAEATLARVREDAASGSQDWDSVMAMREQQLARVGLDFVRMDFGDSTALRLTDEEVTLLQGLAQRWIDNAQAELESLASDPDRYLERLPGLQRDIDLGKAQLRAAGEGKVVKENWFVIYDRRWRAASEALDEARADAAAHRSDAAGRSPEQQSTPRRAAADALPDARTAAQLEVWRTERLAQAMARWQAAVDLDAGDPARPARVAQAQEHLGRAIEAQRGAADPLDIVRMREDQAHEASAEVARLQAIPRDQPLTQAEHTSLLDAMQDDIQARTGRLRELAEHPRDQNKLLDEVDRLHSDTREYLYAREGRVATAVLRSRQLDIAKRLADAADRRLAQAQAQADVPAALRQRVALQAALVAQDAYNRSPVNPRGGAGVAGFEEVSGDAQALASLGLSPEDIQGNGVRVRVYQPDASHREAGYKTMVVFRGSEVGREALPNWRDNLRAIRGRDSQYNQRAAEIGRKLKDADADVLLVGHSMGGRLATVASATSGRDAITFNAAGVHENTLKTLPQSNGRVTAYRVAGDPLTALQDRTRLPSASGEVITLPGPRRGNGTTNHLMEPVVDALRGQVTRGRDVDASLLEGTRLAPDDRRMRSMLKALRKAGTPDALEAARLIESGELSVNVFKRDPLNGSREGLYVHGADYVGIVAPHAWLNRPSRLAGIVAHESVHYRHRDTADPHSLDIEVQATRAQGAIDKRHWSNRLNDEQLRGELTRRGAEVADADSSAALRGRDRLLVGLGAAGVAAAAPTEMTGGIASAVGAGAVAWGAWKARGKRPPGTRDMVLLALRGDAAGARDVAAALDRRNAGVSTPHADLANGLNREHARMAEAFGRAGTNGNWALRQIDKWLARGLKTGRPSEVGEVRRIAQGLGLEQADVTKAAIAYRRLSGYVMDAEVQPKLDRLAEQLRGIPVAPTRDELMAEWQAVSHRGRAPGYRIATADLRAGLGNDRHKMLTSEALAQRARDEGMSAQHVDELVEAHAALRATIENARRMPKLRNDARALGSSPRVPYNEREILESAFGNDPRSAEIRRAVEGTKPGWGRVRERNVYRRMLRAAVRGDEAKAERLAVPADRAGSRLAGHNRSRVDRVLDARREFDRQIEHVGGNTALSEFYASARQELLRPLGAYAEHGPAELVDQFIRNERRLEPGLADATQTAPELKARRELLAALEQDVAAHDWGGAAQRVEVWSASDAADMGLKSRAQSVLAARGDYEVLREAVVDYLNVPRKAAFVGEKLWVPGVTVPSLVVAADAWLVPRFGVGAVELANAVAFTTRAGTLIAKPLLLRNIHNQLDQLDALLADGKTAADPAFVQTVDWLRNTMLSKDRRSLTIPVGRMVGERWGWRDFTLSRPSKASWYGFAPDAQARYLERLDTLARSDASPAELAAAAAGLRKGLAVWQPHTWAGNVDHVTKLGTYVVNLASYGYAATHPGQTFHVDLTQWNNGYQVLRNVGASSFAAGNLGLLVNNSSTWRDALIGKRQWMTDTFRTAWSKGSLGVAYLAGGTAGATSSGIEAWGAIGSAGGPQWLAAVEASGYGIGYLGIGAFAAKMAWDNGRGRFRYLAPEGPLGLGTSVALVNAPKVMPAVESAVIAIAGGLAAALASDVDASEEEPSGMHSNTITTAPMAASSEKADSTPTPPTPNRPSASPSSEATHVPPDRPTAGTAVEPNSPNTPRQPAREPSYSEPGSTSPPPGGAVRIRRGESLWKVGSDNWRWLLSEDEQAALAALRPGDAPSNVVVDRAATNKLIRELGLDPALNDGVVTRNPRDPDRLLPGQVLDLRRLASAWEPPQDKRNRNSRVR